MAAFLPPRRALIRANWALRYESRLRDAGQPHCTNIVRSHWLPSRIRVLRFLPALSSEPGHRPAHETRWAAEGKRVMSGPISPRITWAAMELIPGIVVSCST